MKKIAIIGFGNHVEKNILPAIKRMDTLEVQAVYVRNIKNYEAKKSEYSLNFKYMTDDIEEEVEWIYIATPISTHYELSEYYLNLGKNVICEKPLTENIDKSNELFELAKKKGLDLKEVKMYKHHKQYKHLESFVSENIKDIKVVKTSFTIPHLDKNNIRYKKNLCGGASLDVGYYPLSILKSLFGEPKYSNIINYTEDGYEVDLFGRVLFEYDTFYCIGEWGIGLPYSNEITIITEKKSLKYERIFSKPETLITKVIVKEGFNEEVIQIGQDDQFVNMLHKIVVERG